MTLIDMNAVQSAAALKGATVTINGATGKSLVNNASTVPKYLQGYDFIKPVNNVKKTKCCLPIKGGSTHLVDHLIIQMLLKF